MIATETTTLLQKGIHAAQEGQREAARRFLQAALDAEPESEVAWIWLASLADDPDDALRFYQKALDCNPDSSTAREGILVARLQLGIAAAQAGHADHARDALQSVVRDDPRNEIAWHWLASLAGSPEESRDCLRKVLELNPGNTHARDLLDEIEQDLAEQARVCPLCAKKGVAPPIKCGGCGALVSLADPKEFATHQGANLAQMKLAAAHYEKLLTEDPDFAAQYGLALALLNLKRWEPAFAALSAALSLQPRNQELRSRVNAFVALRDQFESASRAASQVKRGTVFIVDDSPTVRKLVVLTLEKEGYEVITAADGTEAAERLRSVLPNLILLDIMMPGIDGYQVCKSIRASGETRKIPIVLLSGKDGFFDKIRGRMAGCSDYITKPFHPTALLRVAETYCRSSKS